MILTKKPRIQKPGQSSFKAGIRPTNKPKFGMKAGMNASPMGAAPGAVPPSTPPVQTMNDSGYQSSLNNLQTNLNDQNLALGNKEFGVREQFGFDPQFANSPYTRASLLQRAADQRFRSTTNSMAGRGQLYSGATSRARAADTFTAGAETDAARREYQQLLSGIEGEKLAAQREFEQGSSGAYQDMIDRYLDQEPDAGLFSDDSGGGGGGPKGSKKQPQKKQGANLVKSGIKPVKKKVDPGFTKPVQGPNYPKKKGKK